MGEAAGWHHVLGRVAFLNCDPLYHELPDPWRVLPAPPAWLTRHLLTRDCIVAPIPAADFAHHAADLQLLPGLAIASRGEVGSVLVFSRRPLSKARDVALPSDSATSRRLVMWWFAEQGLEPRPVSMGPDLDVMLERCDAALLIGDRALEEAQRHPELVALDLGAAWREATGLPMVFGVMAARRDAPAAAVAAAHEVLTDRLAAFHDDPGWRAAVIDASEARSGFPRARLEQYFDEVDNRLDAEATRGLERFLSEVCGLTDQIAWFDA